MAAIKQILNLKDNIFQIESEGSSSVEVWGKIYFDRYELTKDLINLYVVNKFFDAKGKPREIVTYIGAFAKESVEVVLGEEAEE